MPGDGDRYTSDIGTAKVAASEVVEASSRFATEFQGRVDDIVEAMSAAGASFSTESQRAADALAQSGASFESDTRKLGERFIAELKTQTEAVAAQMRAAAATFETQCRRSSDALGVAGARFGSEMEEAQAALGELKRHLDVTASQVERMVSELRELDLGGRLAELRRWVYGSIGFNVLVVVYLVLSR